MNAILEYLNSLHAVKSFVRLSSNCVLENECELWSLTFSRTTFIRTTSANETPSADIYVDSGGVISLLQHCTRTIPKVPQVQNIVPARVYYPRQLLDLTVCDGLPSNPAFFRHHISELTA